MDVYEYFHNKVLGEMYKRCIAKILIQVIIMQNDFTLVCFL